ncbi:hypothetical protein DVH26_03450 [Paenibacillus sp. H1-7]|uniref:MORN repeat-containing protein n=1 Tax=Paenibacillus sp. H1-7 TaxID=2282849 RepID=UPI001EF89756|nr:hypothetical protein [Paenibacillus sp. H1-7]ULL13584.1 hypothetical protein DVH26_03450 [Paenibacillus sp. H1-7]
MTVSNFAFVKAALPELHALASKAERTMDSAPLVTLQYLQLMGQWFVTTILMHEDLAPGSAEPMARLETLLRNEIVPERWSAVLKRLEYMDTRESELLLDPAIGKRRLFEMYDFTCWYYKTYIDDEYEPSPAYVSSQSLCISSMESTEVRREHVQSQIGINGQHFEAQWERHIGNGHRIETAEGESYQGEWHNGMKQGTGVYRWSDGTKYTGQWSRDVEHGFGEKQYANGDTYRGEWREGLFYGKGTYQWNDGAEYVGQWEDNMEHGYGVKTLRDGAVHRGLWVYGELVVREDQLAGGRDKMTGSANG